jgi:hypothetical protein
MYGFRVVGSAWNRRKLVDADRTLAAYAACDPLAEVNKEAYLSAFTFGKDFATFLRRSGGFTKGYDGPCCAAYIHWDVDRDSLDEALLDVRRLATVIRDRYGEPIVYYSGSKGFHVDSPADFDASPSFNKVAKAFALAVAGSISIDEGVYDKVRLFRAPNSKHPKTGRHKVCLSFDELLGLELAAIQELAAQPRPFSLPESIVTEQAKIDWQAAIAEVERTVEAAKVMREGDAHLNRLTLQFIREGAAKGDRHRMLFSAAANLGEFGCPRDLAHALLTESALDTGLSPSDVERQIECGLNHLMVANG